MAMAFARACVSEMQEQFMLAEADSDESIAETAQRTQRLKIA
jgi:hypothetical protein